MILGVNDLSSQTPVTPLERLRLVRQVLAIEAAALTRLASDIGPESVDAAERIAACQGSIVITGVGKAGWIGQKWVATLGSTGNRAHFLHPSEAVHGDLGRVGADDLVVAISNSGRSEEVLRIAPYLANHSTGLIAITGSTRNPLADLADLVVAVGHHDEADPLGLAPTTSTTAILAVCDAIAMLASRLVGFAAHDFARLHPGGSLGHKLAPVDRLMRPLSQCRIAAAEGTVRETMVASGIGVRRTGAVMLVDRQGLLAGLFTDSDLARLLEKRLDDSLDGPIGAVMTSRFRKVESGSLLVEAIEVLKDQRISELPVVDALGKPIGLLDITDVLAVQEIAATQPSGATRSRRRAGQPSAAELGADGVVRMVPKRRRA